MEARVTQSIATLIGSNARIRLFLGTALGLTAFAAAGPASAQNSCTSTAPASDTTVVCSGTSTTGVIANTSTGVTVNIDPNASVVPFSGPTIWLGGNAEVNVGTGAAIGQNTSNSYAVLLGDGSSVTVDGTINGRGGITGPSQGSGGSSGLFDATITLNQGSQIVTNGTGSNAGIDGRAGSNIYQIDGAIRATGTSGRGISVGSGDELTIGATGSITTLFGDTSDPVAGFSMTGVTVVTEAGSLIELHGIGRGIQLGANANVTVGGTIRSYGDASILNSAGGVGVEVATGSFVHLIEGGQIITGNTGNLGNRGAGGTGISTFRDGALPGSTVIVDGTIDTQRAQGIFAGAGDDITIGETGLITTRSSSRGIFANLLTTTTNHTITLDVSGRIEQLGTGAAVYFTATRSGTETGETGGIANITIHEGGELFAQANSAYGQDDGFSTFPEIVDNFILAGSALRGNAGTLIDLNDGADRITFLPTYALSANGTINGGSDVDALPETDTFALDGGVGTTATFNFAANSIVNFEAGEKLGEGSWTLTGNTTGLNGIFAVNQGQLIVDGTMTNTGASVASGAVLGGSGAFGGAVTVAGGGTLLGVAGADLGFGSLVLGNTSRIDVALGTPSNAALFVVTGALTLDGLLNIEDAGGFGLGTYRLFNYGGALTDNGLVISGFPAGFNPGNWAIDAATTGQVDLLVVAGPGEQYWDGANMTPGGTANGRGGSGVWNDANTNWTNQAGTINAAWFGEKAVFAAAGPSVVTVVGEQAFTGMRFLGNGDYRFDPGAAGALAIANAATEILTEQASGETTSVTIAAPIDGTGGLVKTGAGTLTLAGTNTYAGATAVEGGTLVVTGATEGTASLAVGVGAGTDGALVIEDGGTLATDGDAEIGALEGTGSVLVSGEGSGLTVEGTLAVGNSLGRGTLTIEDGAVVTSAIGAIRDPSATLPEIVSSALVTGAGSAWNTGALVIEGGELAIAAGGTVEVADGTGTVFVGIDAEPEAGVSVLNIGLGESSAPGRLSAAQVELGTLGLLGFRHNATGYVFGPVIAGEGTVIADFGTTILTGNSGAFAGVTEIGDTATLQIGNGGAAGALGGPIENEGALIVDRSGTLTLAGIISGAGTFSHNGPGTTTLSGINTYTGATTVNDGTLLVSGSIAGSATTVNNGAALGGTGTLGTTSISAGGVLSPGASIGTLSIAGNLSLSSGSNVLIELDGISADLIDVSGTASLAGTLTALDLGGAYGDGEEYTVLQAGGGLSGTFNSLVVQGAFDDLVPTLSYTGTSVLLTLEEAAPTTTFTTSTTEHETVTSETLPGFAVTGPAPAILVTQLGGALAGPLGPEIEGFLGNAGLIGPAGAPALIDTEQSTETIATTDIAFGPGVILIGPNQSQTFFVQDGTINLNTNTHTETFTHNIFRISRPLTQQGANVLAGDLYTTFQTVLSDEGFHFADRLLARGRAADAQDGDGLILWASGAFADGNLDGDAANLGFEFETQGGEIGLEHDGGDWLAGAAFGYGRARIVQDATADSGKIDSWRGGLYAAWQPGGWTLNGTLTVAWHGIESTRLSGLANPARASYDARTISAGAAATTSIAIGKGGIDPLGGMVFTSLDVGEFGEHGTPQLAVAGAGRTIEALKAYAGARAWVDLGEVTPELSVRVVHDLLDDPRGYTARFVDDPAGTPMPVTGLQPERTAVMLGGRLGFDLGPNLRASLRYDAELRGGDTTHYGGAVLSIGF
jgi:fibronectin-binding autotransporter adhesin